MPVPHRWRSGIAGEIVFRPLSEWVLRPEQMTPADVNAELMQVAPEHHRACLRRMAEANWTLPNRFVDVTASGPVATCDSVRFHDVHGVPSTGQPGVHAITYMSLAFANEVLRQETRVEGLQPWLRGLFFVACKRFERRHSSPVHAVALAFDRLRREWPQARFVEGELYEGQDMMYTPTSAMRPALVGLSALLRHHASVSYSERRPVDMDMSMHGGGYLTSRRRPSSVVGRRRVVVTSCGFLCPLWAR